MRNPSARVMFQPSTNRLLFAFLALLLVCPTHPAQTTSPTLAALQRDYAMRFLEPEPHMALAKYYFDHGNRILAFFISEDARRGRFEEKIFNPAFSRAFDGFDNSQAAEARLLAEQITRHSPAAVAACLRSVTRGLNVSIDEGLAIEAMQFGSMVPTPDIRRGIDAFLSRRRRTV